MEKLRKPYLKERKDWQTLREEGKEFQREQELGTKEERKAEVRAQGTKRLLGWKERVSIEEKCGGRKEWGGGEHDH